MFTTTLKALAFGFLLVIWGAAADDPFVGKWKLNVTKSQTAGQRIKIDELGPNKYRFDDGAVPQVVVADGTDQPMDFGGTMSLQKTGANTWKAVNKRDGRTLSESTWTVSSDGKALDVHTTGTRMDGSMFDAEMEVVRVGGGSGLAGTWDTRDQKVSSPAVWEIQPHEGGLSLVYPASKGRLDIKFDGKEYTPEGPNAPKGITTSGKRENANTLLLTEKHDGKVLSTTEWRISTDRKTLTMTAHNTGQSKPEVLVYERQ